MIASSIGIQKCHARVGLTSTIEINIAISYLSDIITLLAKPFLEPNFFIGLETELLLYLNAYYRWY